MTSTIEAIRNSVHLAKATGEVSQKYLPIENSEFSRKDLMELFETTFEGLNLQIEHHENIIRGCEQLTEDLEARITEFEQSS